MSYFPTFEQQDEDYNFIEGFENDTNQMFDDWLTQEEDTNTNMYDNDFDETMLEQPHSMFTYLQDKYKGDVESKLQKERTARREQHAKNIKQSWEKLQRPREQALIDARRQRRKELLPRTNSTAETVKVMKRRREEPSSTNEQRRDVSRGIVPRRYTGTGMYHDMNLPTLVRQVGGDPYGREVIHYCKSVAL